MIGFRVAQLGDLGLSLTPGDQELHVFHMRPAVFRVSP